MAKKEKKKMINGVRVYYKWNLCHIITMLFILITIAVPVLLYFNIPGFIKFGDDPASGVTVKNMIMVLFNVEEPTAGLLALKNQISSLAGDGKDQVIVVMVNIIWYVMLALPMTTAIIAVIALFFFFFGLSGRWKHPAGPKNLAWWQFALSIVSFAIPVTFSILYNNTPDVTTKFDFIIPIIFVGASFVSALIQTIFYCAIEKGKMFYKDALLLPPLTPTQPVGVAPQFVGGGYNGPQVQIIPYPFPTNPTAPTTAPTTEAPVAEPKEVKPTVSHNLPAKLSSIGGHAFSQNENLEIATIPNGIKEIGPSAFSNCPNLTVVSIPLTVKKIGYNAFFNCKKLTRINYAGKKSEWKNIVRGSNWLTNAGTTRVICSDGVIVVNPFH